MLITSIASTRPDPAGFFMSSALYESTSKSGEQALWCAVLRQMFMDARHPSYTSFNGRAACKREARHWLLRNREDFHIVCESAGLDPSMVRDKARRLFR